MMEVGKTYHIVGSNKKLRHDGSCESWNVIATFTGTEGDGDHLFTIENDVPYLLPKGYLLSSIATCMVAVPLCPPCLCET